MKEENKPGCCDDELPWNCDTEREMNKKAEESIEDDYLVTTKILELIDMTDYDELLQQQKDNLELILIDLFDKYGDIKAPIANAKFQIPNYSDIF